MVKQTHQEIAQALSQGHSVEVRIMRYKYYLNLVSSAYGPSEVHATPAGKGSTAKAYPPEAYEYTHGGSTFRAAVELCRDVEEAFWAFNQERQAISN